MAKLDSRASIEKIVSNTVANSNENEKKPRAYTRESSIDHDEIDLKVYRAILRATSQDIKNKLTETTRSVRHGTFVGDLLLSLPKFSKVDPTNRNIVREAIESLQERRLVRSTGFGRDQFVFATDGGHYNEIIDRDVNGNIIGKRIVTSFFSRNENPLKRLYDQQKEKAISQQIQNERAEQIEQEILNEEISSETAQNQIDDVEEYQEPEFEFADDDFSDDDSDLNSDTPKI
jgi:hypothetical protein